MATPNKQKRKRQTISLEDKLAIIDAAADVKTIPALAKNFNNRYPESTLKTILGSKDKIQQAIDDGASGKRSNLKSGKHPNLEEALLKWLKDVRSENVPVDGSLLKVSYNVKLNLIDKF